MRLSPEEELFLRHWMYDEFHYQDGQGPAKRLQLQHQAVPADLSVLIAAAIPNLEDQESAALDRPATESLTWPWSENGLEDRIAEARAALANRTKARQSR